MKGEQRGRGGMSRKGGGKNKQRGRGDEQAEREEE